MVFYCFSHKRSQRCIKIEVAYFEVITDAMRITLGEQSLDDRMDRGVDEFLNNLFFEVIFS